MSARPYCGTTCPMRFVENEDMLDLLLATVHTEGAVGTKTGLKRVTCGICNHDYFYMLTVTAEASARTAALVGDKAAAFQTASERAEVKLARRFERRDDPIPCPNCGQLQENMLAGLRKKHADDARVWAAVPVAATALAGLGAGIWIPLGVSEDRGDYLNAGLILAGVAVVGLIVSYFACRRLLRIWNSDATSPLFLGELREGRTRHIDISAMHSSILRRLAELKAGTGGMSAAQAEAERWQLGNLLDQIAVYIPRTEWSRHESLQPSAETAKPWRRPPG